MQVLAMISMFLDHYAVICGGPQVLRSIGRIAFPVYAYLSMETAMGKTPRQRWFYIAGLMGLALVSEPLFDMMHFDMLAAGAAVFALQNVVWTLTAAAAAAAICESGRVPAVVKVIAWPCVCIAAVLCNFEFHIVGICLSLLYWLPYRIKYIPRWFGAFAYAAGMTVVCVVSAAAPWWNYLPAFGVPLLIFIRNRKPDWLNGRPPAGYLKFYHWFYPGHMTLLLLDDIAGYLVLLAAIIESALTG